LFFPAAVNACASETVLDVPKKEAAERIEKGDLAFILDSPPSRMAELSKINAALPFYAALLVEEREAGNERTEYLLREALKSPYAREAAAKKLAAMLGNDVARPQPGGEDAADGAARDIAAGMYALERRDYNEALRRFRDVPDMEIFLLDNDLLSSLGRAFQFASMPGPSDGAELFLRWEKEIREGNRIWALPDEDKRLKRYILTFYAARMKRRMWLNWRADEYGEAEALFIKALGLAPDGEQTDACIWYILDMPLAKNDKNMEKTAALIKKYAPFWDNPANFSDVFEKFTHLLCLNNRWDEIAGLFPYIRSYGSPEILTKYAFILGNTVELNFLTTEKAAAALVPLFSDADGEKIHGNAIGTPEPSDFYRIAYKSGLNPADDTVSFYYFAASAKKLGKKPRLNIPGAAKEASGAETDRNIKEFLDGFFTFGAARFAYPYIIENISGLSIPELRSFAETLAEDGRWGESIRLARTYMQRPGYTPALDDLKICYPFAYRRFVAEASRKTGMDEALLYGLIRTESIFMPEVVSSAGAVGLTQLMPETARETALRLKRRGGADYFTDGAPGSGLNLTDPALNIHLGAVYFEQLKESTGSVLLALLSYNGGVNRIRRWRGARKSLNEALFLESIEYAETRNYGRQVLAASEIYRCLYGI
jgi:soluble lytic murein transglycosylase